METGLTSFCSDRSEVDLVMLFGTGRCGLDESDSPTSCVRRRGGGVRSSLGLIRCQGSVMVEVQYAAQCNFDCPRAAFTQLCRLSGCMF